MSVALAGDIVFTTANCAADKVDLVSKQVADAFGGKGGGRSGRYQGKAATLTQTQIKQAMQKMTVSVTAAQQ